MEIELPLMIVGGLLDDGLRADRGYPEGRRFHA